MPSQGGPIGPPFFFSSFEFRAFKPFEQKVTKGTKLLFRAFFVSFVTFCKTAGEFLSVLIREIRG